jgi:hypothetical protein
VARILVSRWGFTMQREIAFPSVVFAQLPGGVVRVLRFAAILRAAAVFQGTDRTIFRGAGLSA